MELNEYLKYQIKDIIEEYPYYYMEMKTLKFSFLGSVYSFKFLDKEFSQTPTTGYVYNTVFMNGKVLNVKCLDVFYRERTGNFSVINFKNVYNKYVSPVSVNKQYVVFLFKSELEKNKFKLMA